MLEGWGGGGGGGEGGAGGGGRGEMLDFKGKPNESSITSHSDGNRIQTIHVAVFQSISGPVWDLRNSLKT